MWGIDKLDTLRLPRLWDWAQMVTTADGTTFDNYMTNMRKLLTDPMKIADMICVNRCGPNFNKGSWRRQLRAMNANAAMACLNAAGLDYVESEKGITYEHKGNERSAFVDENGHDSCINLWVSDDNVITEIDWSTYTG